MIDLNFDPSTQITKILIKGDITDADLQGATAELERQMEADGRLLVMQIIEDVGEVEPSPYWDSVTRHLQKFHQRGKAAIVADSRWKTWFSEMLHPYVGEDIRVFETDRMADAQAWLLGEADAGEKLGQAKAG